MVRNSLNKGVKFDESGFLTDFDMWDYELAKIIAHNENITELSSEHWKLIFFLRDYYNKHEVCPMIRQICCATGLCLKDIYRLFPSGPVKGLFRIAGLPRPTNCL